MRFCLSFFMLLLIAELLFAQQPLTQTIRGTVTDHASNQSMPFVTVVVSGTSSGTISDNSGNFTLSKIPVGRYSIQASMIGYESVVVKEVEITSGKEVFLSIEMKESVTSLKEVVVKPRINKTQPLNNSAIASARMLSVEEAKRYAGGFDDPARLVSSFAGVSGNVGTNSIIIRGNNPQALQWKLEGVEIPNPNHFADLSSFGGGALTALSSQVLSNSDFFTGAMPAEYNNALSGVFDIFMRNGNNNKAEHTFQIGPLGIDYASEGPFTKKRKSSYLFNYRYSTLGLLEPILPENAGGTNYQDLSFKLTFPINKSNIITLFGIGLTDRSGAQAKMNPVDWQYVTDMERMDARQFMGATGISQKVFLNDKQFIKSTLALTASGIRLFTDRLDENLILQPRNSIRNKNYSVVLSSFLNTKINARHTNKTGFTATEMMYDMKMDHAPKEGIPMQGIVNESGKSTLLSIYSNSNLNFSHKFSANLGLNAQLFTLNNRFTLEPRLGIKYEMGSGQYFTFAYGLHSRLERLNFYFVKNAASEILNPQLDFSKAHHLVLGYEISPTGFTHLKVEAYLQYLFSIPVIADSSFSFVNLQNDWFFDSKLENTGKGRNYGVDITFEKYFSRGFYYMITSSLFSSKYSGGDKVWRNTRYNRNFIFNFLVGKEWTAGKGKQNTYGLNARMSYWGGEHYSPVSSQASSEQHEVVTDETRAFDKQILPPFTAHFTALYRINRKKTSHEFALKIINLTQYKDFQGFQYNVQTGKVDEQREVIFIPNLSWKVEF
jgi:hypothetical protein